MEVVDTRYGKLISSRNDKYLGKGLFKYGEFSEGEVRLFRKIIKPHHVVCDVGANIGAHTLALSRIAGCVLSFEPNPTLFNCMAGMIVLNDLKNVYAQQAGISDKEGAMAYMDIDFDIHNNFGAHHLEKFEGTRGVRVFPLEVPCHFVKIDVEGMEVQVLKGAAPMIRECKPAIYVEADRVDRFEELYSTLKDLGYYAYWHTPQLFNPDNFYGDKENIFGEIASFNLICSTEKVPNWEVACSTVDKHPSVSGFATLNI
jgi:FkbM family methyltransferase